MRGQKQLNIELLKENVLDELTLPLEELGEISVHNPHKIALDVQVKHLKTVPETKRYKFIFIVDAWSGPTPTILIPTVMLD